MADITYYEIGYIQDGYYETIVVSDAITLSGAFSPSFTVDIADDTGYYIPDYIETGYYAIPIQEADASISSSSTITIDGTKVSFLGANNTPAGETYEATFAFSIVYGNIVSSDAITLDAEFSNTTTNSRIRDVEVTITDAFSPSININVEAVAQSSINVSFAMTSDAARTRLVDVTLANIINQSLQGDRIRFVDSTFNSTSSLAVDATRIKYFSSTQDLQTSLTATISHIEGADLTVSPFATLSVDAIKTVDAQSNQGISVFSNIVGGVTYEQSASISSSTSWTISARILLRNITITSNTSDGFGIDNSVYKFGGGSLKIPNDTITHHPGLIRYSDNRGNALTVGSTHYWITPILYNDVNYNDGKTFTSTNGTNWTATTNNLGDRTHGAYYAPIIHTGSQFVTLRGEPNENYYYTSTNGTSWTETHIGTTNSSTTTSYSYAEYIDYFGGNYYMPYVFGSFGSGSRFIYLRKTSNPTSDYTTHINLFDFGSASGGKHIDATLNTGSELIYVGRGGTYDAIIKSTTNGSTFTTWTNVPQNSVNGLFKNGSTYYLAYVNGDVATTTDKTNWTTYSGIYLQDIVNGVFIRKSASNLTINYSTTINGSLTEIHNTIDSNLKSRISYLSGKYVYADYDKIYSTSTLSGGFNTTTDFTAASVPGRITYELEQAEDINSISFWARVSDYGGFSPTITLWNSSNGTRLELTYPYNSGVNSTYSASPYTGDYGAATYSTGFFNNNFGNWFFVQVSVGTTSTTIRVNGAVAHQFATTSDSRTLTFDRITIGGQGGWVLSTNGPIHLDDFKISTSTSVLSTPTAQAINDSNTELLIKFNSDFSDDSRPDVTVEADISSEATLSATGSFIVDADATLNSEFNQTASVSRLLETVLSAFGNASLTTNAGIIFNVDSTASSEFTSTIDNERTRNSEASVLAETIQQTAPGAILDFGIDVDSIATQLTAIGRISEFFINSNIQSTVNADAVKNVDVLSALSVLSSQTAEGIIEVSGEADVTATSTVSTVGERIRFGEGDIQTAVTVTAQDNYIFDSTANSEIVASAEATATGFIKVNAVLQSQFAQTTDSTRFRDNDAVISTDVAITVDAVVLKDVTGAISGEFTQTAQPLKILSFDIDTDAVATQLSVVVKIADFFVNHDIFVTQTTTASKTVGVEANMSSNAAISITATKIHSTATTTQPSVSSLSATASVVSVAGAGISSAFTQNATAVKTGSAVAGINISASLNAVAVAERQFASLVASLGTLSADVGAIRNFEVDFDSIATNLAVGGIITQLSASLSSNFAWNIVGKVIRVDVIEYQIQPESRTYVMPGETRQYSIANETREHIIRGY